MISSCPPASPTRGAAVSSPERAPLPPRPPPPPPPPRFNSLPAARSSVLLGGTEPRRGLGAVGGARRRPMATGEGQRHANEAGGGETPAGGGACGSDSECSGSGRSTTPLTLLQGLPRLLRGGFRAAPASSRFLLSLSQCQPGGRGKKKTRLADFPPLLCYFCTSVTGKQNAEEKSVDFTPCRPRRGLDYTWCPRLSPAARSTSFKRFLTIVKSASLRAFAFIWAVRSNPLIILSDLT